MKRKTSRIIGILLAALMLAGMLPAAAQAAGEIASVAITGVTAPVAGATPTTSGITVTPDPDGSIEAIPSSSIFWRVKNGTSWDDFTGAFEAGKVYSITVSVEAKATYSFSSGFSATVNGNNATEIANPSGMRRNIIYSFGILPVTSYTLKGASFELPGFIPQNSANENTLWLVNSPDWDKFIVDLEPGGPVPISDCSAVETAFDFLCTDAPCESYLQGEMKDDVTYFLPCIIYKTAGDHTVDFSKVEAGKCSASVDGFKTDFVSSTETTYSGKPAVWLVFAVEKDTPPEYTLSGLTAAFSKISYDSLTHSWGPTGSALTPLWEGGAPASGSVRTACYCFYQDSDLTAKQTAQPKLGDVCYSYILVYNSASDNHSVDYTKVKPGSVTVTIPDFETEVLSITPRAVDGRDGVEIRYKATRSAPLAYDLWVGSTQVDEENASDILGDGGKAKYDPESKTLTLDSPSITTTHNGDAICTESGDLTIKGAATLTASVFSRADLTIDADLTCTRLFSYNSTEIKGGEINVTASSGSGIECHAGTLEISGGNVTVTSTGSYGVNCGLRITGGTVNITGKTNGIYTSNYAGDKTVNITGGSVTITGTEGDGIYSPSGGVTVSGEDTEVTINGQTYAVKLKNALTINAPLGIVEPAGGEVTTITEGSNTYNIVTSGGSPAKTAVIKKPVPVTYTLWVGDTKVTDSNLSGPGWSYVPATNTLTLDNATITTGNSMATNIDKTLIYADTSTDLTIVLKGSSKLSYNGSSLGNQFDRASVAGIYTTGRALTIKGEGSLDISLTGGEWCGTYGIRNSDLRLEGGKVSVVTKQNFSSNNMTCPLYNSDEESSLIITGGTLLLETDYALWNEYAYVIDNPLTVFSANGYEIYGTAIAGGRALVPATTVTSKDFQKYLVLEFLPASTVYGVTVDSAENGSVTADKTTAAEGETVKLTVTPDEGYELDTLTVKDTGGVEITLAEDNSFTMPASGVTVSATFKVPGPAKYPVWVGETQADEENAADILGDGKVSYDPATKTLTFTGSPAITGQHENSLIYADGIDLTITAPSEGLKLDQAATYAINAYNGSVTVNGDLEIANTGGYGIYTPKDITVNGRFTATTAGPLLYTYQGKITVTGDVDAKCTDSGTYAIFAYGGDIVFGGKAKIEAATGTSYIFNTPTGGVTIGGDADITNPGGYGIYVSKDITINGKLTATTGSSPLYTYNGKITVTGDVDAKCSGATYMIFAYGGDIVFGGKAKIETTDGANYLFDAPNGGVKIGGDAELTNPSGYGIYTSKDITINGKLTATTGSSPLYTYNGRITVDGDVDAKCSGATYMFFAYGGDIVFGGKAKIETTDGANYVFNTPNGGVTIGGDAELTNPSGYGIYTSKDITVNGKLTATTALSPLYTYNGSISVAGDADMTAPGTQTYMVFSYGDISFGGSVKAKGADSDYGLLAVGGDVSVVGDFTCSTGKSAVFAFGDVSLGGKADLSAPGDSSSVYLLWASGSVTVGGDLKAVTGNNYGVFANGTVTMLSGKWDVDAKETAIRAAGGIVIPATHKITTPKDGEINEVTIDSITFYTVTEPDGTTIAAHAVIQKSSSGGAIVIKHDVEVAECEGGTVKAEPARAAQGEKITLTPEPAEGFELKELKVTGSGGEIALTDNGDGTCSFAMPDEKVTVTAVFAAKAAPGYDDVTEDDWFHDAVEYVTENGLMNGVGDNKFDPLGDTTRGMIVTILWRYEGSPAAEGESPFADVPEGEWFTDAVKWAAANGIVLGYGDGNFGPKDPITREQFAAILYRYEQYKGGGFTGAWYFPLDFEDAADVSDWADEAMHWCVMKGIITGVTETTLVPGGQATRAQAAMILMRFCELEKG